MPSAEPFSKCSVELTDRGSASLIVVLSLRGLYGIYRLDLQSEDSHPDLNITLFSVLFYGFFTDVPKCEILCRRNLDAALYVEN